MQILLKSIQLFLRYGDFSFFTIVEAAILDLFGAYLDHARRVLSGLYHWLRLMI